MTASASPTIADSLRRAVIDYYEDRRESLEGDSAQMTLETNSGWVERRTQPLLEMLHARGFESLEGAVVADLGCGFGAMSVFLAEQGAKVVGIDVNGSRLEVGRAVAAEHGLAAEFVEASMKDLSILTSERFDLAVHNNSFCYLVAREDRQIALRETLRVLKPSGWLVIRNPNRWHPRDQFTGLPLIHLLPMRATNRVAGALGRARSEVRLLSPSAARRELRSAGFVDIHQVVRADRRPEFLKTVARYQHFTARRPGEASPRLGVGDDLR